MKNFTTFLFFIFISFGAVLAQTADFPIKVYDSSFDDLTEPHVEGAVVTLVDVSDNANTYSLTIVKDNFTGTFNPVFMGVSYGTYDVEITAPDYLTTTTSLIVGESIGWNTVFHISQDASTDFPIKVYDTSFNDLSEPHVEGAVVTLVDVYDASNTYSLTIVKDNFTGTFNPVFMGVRYGTYDVEITAPDYLTTTTNLIVGEGIGWNTVFHISQDATKDFPVKVYDTSFNDLSEPHVEGAVVTLVDVYDASNTYSLTIVKDNFTGTFNPVFMGVRYGTYDVEITATDYLTTTSNLIVGEGIGWNTVFHISQDATKDFPIKVYDAGFDDLSEPHVEGAVVTLEDVYDAVNTYSLTIVKDNFTGTFNSVFMGVRYGTYSVEVVANGYTTLNTTLNVGADIGWNTIFHIESTATSIIDQSLDLSLYPNPTRGVLNFTSSSVISSVELYGLSGVELKKFAGVDIKQVDISDLSAGVYIIKALDVDGNSLIKKITKR